MQGYANPDIRYISSGIVFEKNKVDAIKNRIFYDRILTPSKPAQGGFWGSTYTPEGQYRSDWERFIHEKMYLQKEWIEKIKRPSTIFTLKPNTKLLFLNKFEDLYEEMIPKGNGGNGSNGSNGGSGVELRKPTVFMRNVKVTRPEFKDYAKQPFIDFEKQQNIFDAMVVSKHFVELVAWCLRAFEIKVTALQEQGVVVTNEVLNECVYNEELTEYDVIFAEMFEDWHVESVFVLNPECVNVVEVLPEV